MHNFDFSTLSTMISTMNLKELNAFQNKIQAEIQNAITNQNKAVEELKASLSDTIQKLVALTGSYDLVDEVVQQEKAGHTENVVVNDESPVCEEQETEEQVSVIENTEPENENNVFLDDDHLPSFAELYGEELVKDIDENPDPYEYCNEEEYLLAKKRAGMLRPLDNLLSGEVSPRISRLGFRKPKDTAFRQCERIFDSVGGLGNTLTAASSGSLIYVQKDSA